MPKMKSRRNAKKHYRMTATGKIKRRKTLRRHILTHKTTKRKRHLRKSGLVHKSEAYKVRRFLLA